VIKKITKIIQNSSHEGPLSKSITLFVHISYPLGVVHTRIDVESLSNFSNVIGLKLKLGLWAFIL